VVIAHFVTRIRNRLSDIDGQTRSLLQGASLAFLLRGIGAGLAFLLSVVVGRLLGAEGTGLYFTALSVVSIGSVVARVGLDNTVLRFVAAGAANDDWGQVRGVFRLSLGLSACIALGLGALVLLFAPILSDRMFGNPDLATSLRLMALGILSFSMMTLLAESLKGLQRVRNSMLVSGILYPLTALIVIWPLVRMFGPGGAGVSFVLGTGVSAMVGWWFWYRAMATHPTPATPFPRNVLWASCRPLWVMALVNRAILPWAPLFLLGFYASAAEAGIFGAATRVALLVSFFLLAVNTVLAPRFAALHQQGKVHAIARLSRRFALFVTVAASPFFLMFIFAGDWVMGLFGPDFAAGGKVLAILAVGQLINALTGPVGVILMMGGQEKDLQTGSLVAVATLLILAFLLVPTMNAAGAAIASATASIVTSVLATVFVWKRFGVIALPLVPTSRKAGAE